jgi:hypothetical protein
MTASAQKRLLGEVLGFGTAANHAQDVAIDAVAMGLEKYPQVR